MSLEHAVLFAIGKPRIQRQHFGVAQIQLIERIGGIANFTLAAHKDQNITGTFAPQLINRVENRLQLIALGVVMLVADALANIQLRCLADAAASTDLARETTEGLFVALRQALPREVSEPMFAHANQAVIAWQQARRTVH